MGVHEVGEAAGTDLVTAPLRERGFEMGTHAYLDASTRYITEKDDQRLTEIVESGDNSATPLRVIGHDHGYWVHVATHDGAKEERADLLLSDAFWALMDEAIRRGCNWVNIDSDGDDDLDLPMHEW
jgi:hypothetical protein